MPTTRILLVEDFEPFRRFVRSTLAAQPEYEVVGEVSDGLDAVQKAVELQPDLMVLDIGLPGLDGFNVARHVRSLCPQTKILFVSLENSFDAIEEALNLGAHGYVVKTRALDELLPTVEAVCEGRQFVTRTDRPHGVQFYADDESFVAGFAAFVRGALDAGKAVIVLATEAHQGSLLLNLEECGVDITGAARRGLYRAHDCAEAFAYCVVGDRLDEARFHEAADACIAEAAAAVAGDFSRVAVCGECAPQLLSQGKIDVALQIEHLWDEITRIHQVETLCGYMWPASPFHQRDVYERICAEHSTISKAP